jgi:hypothetical protein
MERDDGEPAAGRQQLFGRGKPAIELSEFVIHRDPKSLEGPRRRIQPRLGRRYSTAYDLGELGRSPNGFALSCRRDCTSDPARETLFAESAYHIR